MTYKEFDAKVKYFEIHRKKRISVEVIANTLGAIFIIIGFLTLCYGLMINFYEQVSQAASLNIPIISYLWNFLVNKSTLIGFLPPIVATFALGIILLLLIPFIVTGIYSIIIYSIPIKINTEDDFTISINSLNKLSNRLKKTKDYYFIPDFVGVLVNVFFLLISLLTFTYIFISCELAENLEVKLIVAIILGSLIPAGISFIPFLIFKKLSVAISSFMWKNRKVAKFDALKKELDDAISKLKKEEKEKQAERDRQKQIEQNKRKAEEAKKQQEKIKKDMLDGQKMYEEAMASDPVDEKLMKKAAKLGSPSACYYLGKNLLSDWLSDMYTAEEKEKIAQDAAKYFDVARQFAKLTKQDFETECTFLWLYSRLQYESNNKENWKLMLNDFRSIQKSGKLPEEYTETLEVAIKTVVNVIDELTSQPKPQPTYNPEPEKKFYCKFRNGAICTKETNSVMVYHCNYVDNPTACYTARQNKAIEYR